MCNTFSLSHFSFSHVVLVFVVVVVICFCFSSTKSQLHICMYMYVDYRKLIHFLRGFFILLIIIYACVCVLVYVLRECSVLLFLFSVNAALLL